MPELDSLRGVAILSILAIVFFVAEQVGIQGNLPSYDRYVIQMATFLGIVAFALARKLSMPRLLALGASSVLGQYMSWRFAF